ncbi:major facilitator superfamily domain-containing protein [Glomus cerebriforme]|uniref:Major facilitator superfamily domain-containing protein n=1 Tax=Glomus cerebriforme TaxID=658196 RepID=A0A397TP22_9GLOM|nr:major facilitator superfamily domain-containing protein [Glomus cerebriforme]
MTSYREERDALLSDTDTPFNTTSVEVNLLNGHEANSVATEYPKYGWFGRFRRSTTAVVFVAAICLFTDMIVYGIVVPILPLIVRERLGRDSKSVGFLFGCYAIGLLSATPIFAVLSDKYRTRRIPMLFGMFSLAICSILFGISTTYWQLVIARIAQGAAGGASWTLSLAMLADRFGSGPKLGVVMGTVLSANTLGAIIGPLIGGIFYQYWGYVAPFGFCAVLALCGFLVISLIVEPLDLPSTQIVDENSIINDDLDDVNQEFSAQSPSIWSLISDWNIINVCFAIIVVASVLAGLEPILPIYLRNEFDADASQIGLIFIAIAIPAFLSPAVGYISYFIGQRKTCGIGLILLGISTPLISLPNKLLLVALPLLFFGTTYAIVTTPTLPLLAHYVTQKGGGAYGQIYALWNMAYSIGMFVGPVIAGLLFEAFEFKNTLIIFGVSAIAITPLIFVGRLCRNNRRSRVDYEQVGTDEYIDVN